MRNQANMKSFFKLVSNTIAGRPGRYMAVDSHRAPAGASRLITPYLLGYPNSRVCLRLTYFMCGTGVERLLVVAQDRYDRLVLCHGRPGMSGHEEDVWRTVGVNITVNQDVRRKVSGALHTSRHVAARSRLEGKGRLIHLGCNVYSTELTRSKLRADFPGTEAIHEAILGKEFGLQQRTLFSRSHRAREATPTSPRSQQPFCSRLLPPRRRILLESGKCWTAPKTKGEPGVAVVSFHQRVSSTSGRRLLSGFRISRQQKRARPPVDMMAAGQGKTVALLLLLSVTLLSHLASTEVNTIDHRPSRFTAQIAHHTELPYIWDPPEPSNGVDGPLPGKLFRLG
ncbi:hypothetical protein HPB50_020261 [Hyalomma asiaticum]|uniref:Uncharacterized protein n=1 Tax=Hyalomma asiaticum TaxID=266040 RepID=A0ACB7RJ69_HYAAI|nr:hypothetical protein HPB50_020261 [Hyalomma asiaticum]